MILNLSDFLPLLSAFTNPKRQYEIRNKKSILYVYVSKKVSEKQKNCTLYK